MFVLHTKSGGDPAAASTYWRTTHAGIAGAIPGVLAYTQFHATTAPDGGDASFLGVASLEFADDAAFAAAPGSDEFAAPIADLENFADSTAMPTALVERVAVVGRRHLMGYPRLLKPWPSLAVAVTEVRAELPATFRHPR